MSKPTYVSHHAREHIEPAWKTALRRSASRHKVSLLLIGIFALYILATYFDRQDERRAAARVQSEFASYVQAANACGVMNSLPAHIWVIEAKSPEDVRDKLLKLAGAADRTRIALY